MALYTFRTGSYFPKGLPFAGWIVAGFGVLFITVDYSVGLPVTLIGLVVATTHYRLVIDTTTKTYKDGLWFFGIYTGPRVQFDKIEYLFIKSSKESQTMYVRVARSTIHKRVFDGYIRFSETDKVHVATVDKKADLLRKLQPIAAVLKVPINDYTQEA